MTTTVDKLRSRGRLIAPVMFALLLLFALPAHRAHAEAADATEMLREFYQVLLRTMHDGRALGPQGRYAKLEPVIASTFDIDFMAQTAVGPAWNKLSESQQTRLTAAFKRYLVATYADNFDEYGGEALLITGEKPAKHGCMVESRIVKDGVTVEVNYLVAQDGAAWRVRDVYMAGMISELAVRRSQFVSILHRDGVDGLIDLLHQKADKLIKTAEL
ncbi:MAG TPA: ABC transporter substrate-binding protein [Alphaproteobacteria bacterium]